MNELVSKSNLYAAFTSVVGANWRESFCVGHIHIFPRFNFESWTPEEEAKLIGVAESFNLLTSKKIVNRDFSTRTADYGKGFRLVTRSGQMLISHNGD